MQRRLGFDIGSETVKAVILDHNGRISDTLPVLMAAGHHLACVRKLIEIASAGDSTEILLGLTGSGSGMITDILSVDPIREPSALSSAVRRFYPQTRMLINMGASSQMFMPFHHDHKSGRLVMRTPRLSGRCAAGGGSFIREMSRRLNFSSLEEFAQAALETSNPAILSGRCAVFTESDIVHLYQKGTPRERIAAGICQAIARNAINNLGGREPYEGVVLLVGGISENPAMVRYLTEILRERQLFDGMLDIPKGANLTLGAIGAALKATKQVSLEDVLERLSQAQEHTFDYISTGPIKARVHRKHEANEDEIPQEIPVAALGVDIGSVSTKMALVAWGEDRLKILAWHYRRTEGDPVRAVRDCLEKIQEQILDKGYRIRVMLVATTGSGRYLTGDLIGADGVYDEITSQAHGAQIFMPNVRTILEIGGQDSKAIKINPDGSFVSVMNRACAAGTGAFLENVSIMLGFASIEDFCQAALRAQRPAVTDSNCTVFTKRMVDELLEKDVSHEDIAAGVCLASVENYLKNLGNLEVEEPVAFQGATAFNQALVAAFETVLEMDIEVPEFPHITGAVGAAVLLLEDMPNTTSSSFRGFEQIAGDVYEASSFECDKCANRCDVNVYQLGGGNDAISYYYNDRCERYSGAQKRKQKKTTKKFPNLRAEYVRDLLEPTGINLPDDAPTVGIPRYGLFYPYFAFYQRFFECLGYRVVASPETNSRISAMGVESSVGEPCYPAKVFIGHAKSLVEKGVDYIFLPQVCDTELAEGFDEAQVCPFIQAAPDYIVSTLGLKKKGTQVIVGTFHLRLGNRYLEHTCRTIVRQMNRQHATKHVKHKAYEIKQAVRAGLEALQTFRAKIAARGLEVLASLGEDEKAIVVLGRPYTMYDPTVNMDIFRKINDEGYLAIPRDFLPLPDISDDWPDVYSRQIQLHLAAARFVRNHPKLWAIVLTYFNCSPDAFSLEFVRRELNEACYEMQIDEHTADAGVITRMQSHFRTLRHASKGTPKSTLPRCLAINQVGARKILIPPMNEGAHILAKLFGEAGMEAEVLSEIADPSLTLARRAFRRDPCLPMFVTTQYYLEHATKPGFDPAKAAFFQATSQGPCRLGYYQMVDADIFERLGFSEARFCTIGNKSTDTGITPRLSLIGYNALLAHDFLQAMRLAIRPYEIRSGAADEVFNRHLWVLISAIPELLRVSHQGTRELFTPKHLGLMVDLLRSAQDDFLSRMPSQIERKPLILLGGEFFVRLSAFANRDLARKVEACGCEVILAPMTEFFSYTNCIAGQIAWDRTWHAASSQKEFRKELRNWFGRFAYYHLIRRSERRFSQAASQALHGHEYPAASHLIRNATEYVHPHFGGEVTPSMGSALHYANTVDGIILAGPFGCGPTIISGMLVQTYQQDTGVPVIVVDYNGQSDQSEKIEYFLAPIVEEYYEGRREKRIIIAKR
ncbi:MAG: CoA-substrate-specific enzyme activase [Candidatus Berkelbacteria bacterium]|nr:CoA-substrate-specific enzyme activase [Candidatus Berkelbacteria bacterium]